MKRKLLFIGLLAQCYMSFAQYNPLPQRFTNPIAPAPNVASLGKYGDVPIGKYTGIPEIGIPLFSIPVKDFTMNISASYHAGGFQVSEEAGFLGLGWSLNAGGVITQIINDQNDFNGFGYYNVPMPDPVGIVSNGSLGLSNSDYTAVADCNAVIDYPTIVQQKTHSNKDISINCVMAAYTTDVFFDSNNYDTEPDIFFFNFNGFSGKFIYDKKNSVFTCLDRANIKVQFLGNNVGWQLTTPDGNQFHFKAIETTHIRTSTTIYNGQPVVSSKTGPDFNTYYLSKIHLVSGEDILFSYTTGLQVCNLTKRNNQYKASMGQVDSHCSNRGTDEFYSDTYYNPLYLTKIRFPQGKLVFNWSGRDDLLNGQRLTRIEKYDTLASSIVTSSATFENGQYFEGHSSTSYLTQFVGSGCSGTISNNLLYKRLKLSSISLSGNEKPYLFQYNESISLPSKLSYAQDYWGLYNGNDNATTFYPNPFKHYEQIDEIFFYLQSSYPAYQDRSPNENALAWLLTSITYPTKGSTDFFYQNNTYSNYDAQTYNRQVTNAHASVYYSSSYINTTNQTIPITLDVAQKVFVQVSIPSSSTDMYSQNAWARILNSSGQVIWERRAIDGGGVLLSCQSPLLTEMVSLPAGNYTILVDKQQGNQFCNSSGTYYSIDVTYSLPPANSSLKFIKGPGARVNRIVDRDGLGHSYEKNYEYEYTQNIAGATQQFSYGALMNKPLFYQTMQSYGYCGDIGGSANCSTCTSYVIHGSSYNSISKSAKGSYIGYSKVTEWIGNSTTNAGKTITSFLNQSELCQYGNVGPCIQYEENGSTQQIEYYSNTNVKVKIENFEYYQEQRLLLKSYGIKTTDASPSAFDAQLFPGFQSAILHFYPLRAYRYDLKTKSTALYDLKNNRWVTESITYDYYDNGLVKTETKDQSDGTTMQTMFNYPQNIGTSPYPSMNAMNWIDPVIQKVTVQISPSSPTSEIYRQYKSYNQMVDGDILINSIQDSYNGAALQTVLTVNAYDANNNPVSVIDRTGIARSYVYDKTGTFVIAQAENTNSEPVYFNGFEDGDGNVAEGHTGHYSVNNFSYVVSGLTNGNNYLLSYWTKNGTGTWDFHKSSVTATGGLYTINLNGQQVDDVRFHSSLAKMSSYTFEREKGITSVSDINNVVSYYEYDIRNRLESIKDYKENIIRKYSYHVKN